MRQLQEKQASLEKEVSELKQKLETEMKVVQFHPADSPPNHSHLITVIDYVSFSCCVLQNEKTLAKACEKARTEKKKLQEELAKSQTELCKLRDRLTEIEAELQSTKKE